MTELQLRQKVVDVMKSWLGYSEFNGKFKKIINLYNTQNPLPVGYKMKYTDEWCAATVTAAGMEAGLHDIILGECSCSRMIALYKEKGQWMENDAYKPQIGDIVMYYWKDGKNFAITDCTQPPNHVGIVGEVDGNALIIYEGNKGEAVSTRALLVNGRYIRGYCLPDYASKAKEEEDDMDISKLTDAQVEQLASRISAVLSKKGINESADGWSKEDREWAESIGLMKGNEKGQMMYKNNITRLEVVVLFHRFFNYIKSYFGK